MPPRQQLESRIRCALNVLGIVPAQQFGYLSFGRSVAKARRSVNGKDPVTLCGTLVERYAKLGLERPVMYRLLAAVFTIRPDQDWPAS